MVQCCGMRCLNEKSKFFSLICSAAIDKWGALQLYSYLFKIITKSSDKRLDLVRIMVKDDRTHLLYYNGDDNPHITKLHSFKYKLPGNDYDLLTPFQKNQPIDCDIPFIFHWFLYDNKTKQYVDPRKGICFSVSPLCLYSPAEIIKVNDHSEVIVDSSSDKIFFESDRKKVSNLQNNLNLPLSETMQTYTAKANQYFDYRVSNFYYAKLSYILQQQVIAYLDNYTKAPFYKRLTAHHIGRAKKLKTAIRHCRDMKSIRDLLLNQINLMKGDKANQIKIDEHTMSSRWTTKVKHKSKLPTSKYYNALTQAYRKCHLLCPHVFLA
ncbi:MAG: hypothetical protein GY750_00510 [Lentisphaerae bacterium]|nr:hypothetical protein [Lentisphaerota bacterium]MCP4099902.1 hypothetical protein [Lentisphaerota bacterium]